jgi:hypothetical protein
VKATTYNLIVVKMPVDDYLNRDGDYAVATLLAAAHGGRLLTEVSEIHIEIPEGNAAAFTAALDRAGLPWLRDEENED